MKFEMTFFHTVVMGIVGVFLVGETYVNHADRNEPREIFTIDAACELHRKPCRATTPGGKSIELAITPDGIPLLQPLDVSVTLNNLSASAVEVVFSGVDVDMGRLRYPLSSEDAQHFNGVATLSVCSQRRMTWKVTVVITSNGISDSVPFLFDTVYQPRFKML